VPAIVTLTTDFGLSDPYAGQMKAAILSLAPKR
jgi:S-adenosylmethionine hydrolase